ncbi:hypothetical protein FRC17_004954 [Serendipita sp. 399]|nr:hypothetical protein FRC17_004954 [Serendipita sp. 399]
MSLKIYNDKTKASSYSYGRGGAGCRSKSKEPKKSVVDPDVRPMCRMLEIETARNRLTTTGRGGKNIYHHVLEPGVFQRVIDHETARVVAFKAEEKANKEYQEQRKRSNSTSTKECHIGNRETTAHSLAWLAMCDRQWEDEPSTMYSLLFVGPDADSLLWESPAPTLETPRFGPRLRSASTSTFATSTSGSSSTSSHLSSPSSSLSSSLTSSITPTPSVTSKLLSPIKRFVNGGNAKHPDPPGKPSSGRKIEAVTEGMRPFSERTSSLGALAGQAGGLRSRAPTSSTDEHLVLTIPVPVRRSAPCTSTVAAPPHLFSRADEILRERRKHQQWLAPHDHTTHPTSLSNPQHKPTLRLVRSNLDLSASTFNHDYHYMSLSNFDSKDEESLPPTGSLITDIRQEHAPWRKCLSDRPLEQSSKYTARIADCVHGRCQGLPSNPSPSSFTPYHLPLRTNIKRHNRLLEITPGGTPTTHRRDAGAVFI